MSLLAGGLAGRGHEVVLTTMSPGVPDFHRVPPEVKRAALGEAGGPCRWFELGRHRRRIRAVREVISSQAPDAVISFIDATNITALAAFPSGSPPVIACERVNPLYSTAGPHWKLLRRAFYPRAARVVLQTRDTLEPARALGWKAERIPNPVLPPAPAGPRPGFLVREHNIAAAGRLVPQKGFDMLLSAFSGIAGRFPGWQLTIMGDGPEKERLEGLAAKRGLSGQVRFTGTLPSTADVLAASDLFVLSSRFEGFPNALAEALAAGVPAVSFDCPSGPSEIIRDGRDGLLVPPGDIAALGAAMTLLMDDEPRRRAMSASAPEVLERFSLNDFLDSWEKLLAGLARR